LIARRRHNFRGGLIGMWTMLYYIVVNLNPFLRGSQEEVLSYLVQDLVTEYFAIIGVFLLIVANSKRDKK
jgi:hypothetical protein